MWADAWSKRGSQEAFRVKEAGHAKQRCRFHESNECFDDHLIVEYMEIVEFLDGMAASLAK